MSDIQEEIAHLKEVRHILTERRRWLEQQLAHHGFASSPVQVLMDLEHTKKEIDETDARLVQLGEISYSPTGVSLLERIARLEIEVLELRERISSATAYKLDFPISLGWFSINDDKVMIHHRIYHFSDIVQYDADYIDINNHGGIQKYISERVVADWLTNLTNVDDAPLSPRQSGLAA